MKNIGQLCHQIKSDIRMVRNTVQSVHTFLSKKKLDVNAVELNLEQDQELDEIKLC